MLNIFLVLFLDRLLIYQSIQVYVLHFSYFNTESRFVSDTV